MRIVIACIAVGILAPAGILADQQQGWTRFRGPNGSGVAEGQQPPVEFGPNKNVKWKVPVPSGHSSPVVAGENLILTAFEGGKLYTIAYNRSNGKVAWKADAHATKIESYFKAEGSPAVSTPATDGKRIVSYFGSCGLICYDHAGKELWRHKLPPAETYMDFGTGTSPILTSGLVVLVRDVMNGSTIFALDAATGSLKWEKKRRSRVSWCTPVIWETPGGTQIVSSGHGPMISYDLKSGAEKWTVSSMPSGCCSSPFVANGALFFAGWSPGGADDNSSQMPSFDSMLKDLDKDKDGALSKAEAEKAFGGFFDNQDLNHDGKITREEYDDLVKLMADGKNSVFTLKPGGSGNITNTHMIWKKTRGMGYIPSAIVYQGQLVMVKDGGIVTAVDAKTGSEIYVERLGAPGSYHASPVAANGNIYFTSLTGVITVVRAGTSKFEVVTKVPRLDEHIAATPAIADNTLYVRTNKSLYAFGRKN
jgi:outer membrane protein assembly factor BamB